MRLLPPILVASILALIGVRCAMEPHREEAKQRITGFIQSGELDKATGQLERYVGRYETIDDAWYAAQTWFRLRQPLRAIDAVWKDERIAAKKETPRRFAETALLTLGWSGPNRRDATPLEPFVLLPLVEGGAPWAVKRLEGYGATFDLMQVVPYFFPAYRHHSRKPLEVLIRAFRTRGEEKFDVAAAMGALRAEDYPERAADIKVLRDVIASERWRLQFRDVWTVSALALGRSGEPEALESLAKAAAALEGSENERDQIDLPMLHVGMIAGGRFDVDPKLTRYTLGKESHLSVLTWYLEALLHRYKLGDMRSELRLRQIWEGPGKKLQGLRTRIAGAHLLREELPSDDAVKTFVGRMVKDMERPGAPLISRVLSRAWRLRSGEKGGLDGLLEVLRDGAKAIASGTSRGRDAALPFIAALRALYLYG